MTHDNMDHEVWGAKYADYFTHDNIYDLIEELLCDSEDENSRQVFHITGGSVPNNRLINLISDNSDARELILSNFDDREYVVSASNDSLTEVVCENYDCIMEVDFEYCDPFSLSNKMDNTLGRILKREIKRYLDAMDADDEQGVVNACGRLRRRFRRAVRHLPPQRYGVLMDCKDYKLTVYNGEIASLEPE